MITDMSPWTFLIIATALNVAFVWLTYPKGNGNDRSR